MARPSRFDGTQDGSYDEWRFQFFAYLAAVDPRFGGVADEVARRTTPYLTTDLLPDEEGRNAYLMLYSVFVGCIKNRPLRLIMETVSSDGREAIRKLDAEYRPTDKGRQMALLKRIMHPKLNSAGSDAEYIDKLSEWQQVVREYERIFGSELDHTVKTATPPPFQTSNQFGVWGFGVVTPLLPVSVFFLLRRVSLGDHSVIDARRCVSGVCGRWCPILLCLHRFFIAISRAVVNHDGG